jgi:hypothetical protein
MEDVLEVYRRRYDPRFPQVCMDETSKQLLADTRPSEAVRPGHPAHVDYEYRRLGTATLFLFCEPLRGWRRVQVTERRTRLDWAHAIKELLEVHYPQTERIVLVLDNLNTHSPASLYQAFPPAEAKRLADRLEIHHTPKHGSWLNVAEIELSVLARQCLHRRIADAHGRSGCLGAGAERRRQRDRLEVHHRRRAHQAQASLSISGSVTHY